MRLALISDTHMPRDVRRLPDRCLELVGSADVVLHAGDFFAASVFDELAALSKRLLAVHGNVDDAELCRRLPPELTVELESVRIGLVHDAGPRAGRLERLRRRFPEADAVLFGHSHLPLHQRVEGFQIFNPGSPTERRRAPAHTMGVARIERVRIEFELVALD